MSKSTFMTGVAIANSMIGSSMIIFPVTFNDTGVIANVLVVLFMAALMSLTCRLLISNLRQDQQDIGQSILRRLGPTFGVLFSCLSSITLFLVSSVYFLLAVDVFYAFFQGAIGEMSLSQQGFKLIFLGVFAALNFLPDLKYVFKLTTVAMGALIASTLTLIISIPFNRDNIDSGFLSFKSLSALDLLGVVSINGFAFLCHPSISPIIKQHGQQKSNSKAVYYGFSITISIYLAVGVLGALSIYGKIPLIKKDHYNIIDYFQGQPQAPIIGILIFVYLFLISPIFPFVSKNQALQLLSKKKKESISNIWTKATLGYAALWIPLNVLFVIFDTSPNVVISFISTVMAYFVAYFLPIYMTFKKGDYLLQPSNDNLESSLIVQDQQKIDRDYVRAAASESTGTNDGSLITEGDRQTNGGGRPLSKLQKGVYWGVLTYGSVMLVLQLISFFF